MLPRTVPAMNPNAEVDRLVEVGRQLVGLVHEGHAGEPRHSNEQRCETDEHRQ
jgi:hypothetical protein